MAASVDARGPFATGHLGDLLPRGLLLAGLVYPAWYLLTPDGAHDWWPVYWALALLMVLPATLARAFPALRPSIGPACYLVLAALTAQLVCLASLNDMHPFYSVSSVAMALNCTIAMPSRRAYLAFSAYVVALTAVAFALEPQMLMLAYWGPLYVMLVFAFWQLHLRLLAQEELRCHKDDLERLVEERTATLMERTRDLAATNERLVHEIAEREQAEAKLRNWQKLEALGRLAGGVAHDFNNLFTIIGGMAEILRDRLPPGSAERGDTEEICRAAGRAADMTRNLLAFSRQETLEMSRIDLNAVLRDSRPVLESLMGEDVVIALELAPEPVWIHTNRSQLDQLLVNLAVNARDAMPEGGTLAFETRVADAASGGEPGAGRVVELTIRDTGVGMDEETMSRIFDPFFTTKEVGKGTGLGLAAVYGFVEQTSGSIQVESSPGHGTRFSIRWPYRDAQAATRAAAPPARGAQAAGGLRDGVPAPTRRRILVVDDEPSLLRVVRRVLESGGYEVRLASDSQTALRALRDEGRSIDLLLTDVVMPNESGIELARKVSKLRPDLPIVFMSGYLNHPSLKRRELPGSAPLLPKPFPPAALLARLRDAFEGPSAGPRSTGPAPPLA